MSLEDAGELALHIILSNLGPKETARVASVSKRLRHSAYDEALWSLFCSDHLQLSAPLDPDGNTAPSFRAAYRLWREAFAMYPWALVRRVKRCWDVLKSWLARNFPEAEATLRPGATEADLQEVENALDVKLPLPTRILYRFCDGQQLCKEDYHEVVRGWPLGLIGGYAVYDHFINVYLLPLKHMIAETMEVVSTLNCSISSDLVVMAVSSTINEKIFFLDCISGQIFVGTNNLATEGEMLPCVSYSLIRSVHDPNGDQQQDGMLLWFEEHGRRLQNGCIKLREESGIKFINLFPELPPLCSVAVTNGVRVRASSLFAPELADAGQSNYWFIYSIRISLQPEGCIRNGNNYGSCQLYRRHWIIRADDAVIDEVSGEAVIGQFPLLQPGGREFVYQSCSCMQNTTGSIEGFFTFVPGRLMDPKGAPFEVEVARFPLQLPDFIF